MKHVQLIFLDDVREAPSESWLVVRTADEAYAVMRDMIQAGDSIIISLDHDLGDDIPTGYDLLNWLERDIATDDSFRPDIEYRIHSANPVGRVNMASAIQAIKRRMNGQR